MYRKVNPQRKLDAFFTITPTKRAREEEAPIKVEQKVVKPQQQQQQIHVDLTDEPLVTPTEPRPLDPINESQMEGLIGCSNAANQAQCQRIESLVMPCLLKEPAKNGYRRCVVADEIILEQIRDLGFAKHVGHTFDRILVEEFTEGKSGFGYRPEGKDYHPYCSVLTLGTAWPLIFACKALAEREVMYMMRQGCLLEVRDPAYSKAERRVPAQQSMQGRFFGSVFEKGKRKELQIRRDKNFRFLTLTFYHYLTDEDRQRAEQQARWKRAKYAAYKVKEEEEAVED